MNKPFNEKTVLVLLSFFDEKKRLNIIKTSKSYQIKLGYIKDDFVLIDSLAEIVQERDDMSSYLKYYTMKYPNIDKLSIESYLLTYFKEYIKDSPIVLSNENEFTSTVINLLSENIVLNIVSLKAIEGVNIVNSTKIRKVNVKIENINKEQIEILFNTLIPKKVQELNFEYKFLPSLYEIEPNIIYEKITSLKELRKFTIQEELLEENFIKYFGGLKKLENISLLLPNLNFNQRKTFRKALTKYNSLRELNISFMNKPPFKIWSVIPVKFKGIQSLTLSNINMKKSLKLNQLEQIEKLTLSKVSFPDTNIGLEDIKTLKEFTITESEISSKGLAMIILNNPLLTKLTFKLNEQNQENSESDLIFLANAIQSLKLLTELSFYCQPNLLNNGGVSETTILVNRFVSPSLERLTIESVYSGSFTDILLNYKNLEHLQLISSYNNKSDENIDKTILEQFAKQYINYKTFSFNRCLLKTPIIESFLFKCTNVENINFDGSYVSSNNLKTLLHSLHHFNNLKRFSFIDVNLENKVYPDLEEFFPKFNNSINQCSLLEEFKFSIKDMLYIENIKHFKNGIPFFPFMKTLLIYPSFFEKLFLSAHDIK